MLIGFIWYTSNKFLQDVIYFDHHNENNNVLLDFNHAGNLFNQRVFFTFFMILYIQFMIKLCTFATGNHKLIKNVHFIVDNCLRFPTNASMSISYLQNVI